MDNAVTLGVGERLISLRPDGPQGGKVGIMFNPGMEEKIAELYAIIGKNTNMQELVRFLTEKGIVFFDAQSL